MEELKLKQDCEQVFNEFGDDDGDTGKNNSQDHPDLCLFCSKHCNRSTDQYNLESSELNRVFNSLQINISEILKKKSVLAVCQNCDSVIRKLSSLFKDLDVTKMWINHVLRNLMKIIISGEDDESVQDDYDKVVLRELIMEKCISTVKATSLPQLQLDRCQLPENQQETQLINEDDQLSTASSSPSSVKVEETPKTFLDELDTTTPSSPVQHFEEPPPSFQIPEKAKTSPKKKSKHKPFWFVKPTIKITPTGQQSTHYLCSFCPKSFNGISAIKFHTISSHPEHLFQTHKLPNLNPNQFRACCFTILEQEVILINHEDDVGSFTTFQCKYCPSSSKHKTSSAKKVIQKHLICGHYDILVRELISLQLLQGTKEFDDKVANYLVKLTNPRKRGSHIFRKKWRCNRCTCGFPNVKRLEWHKKTCDGSTGGKQLKGCNNEASSTVPKASPCETCGKIFSCGYSLWRHKRLSCVKDLNGQPLQLKVEDEDDVEIIEEQMEEEILPEVKEVDPLMSFPPPPTQLDKIVKLEEIEVVDTQPSSPPQIYFCSEEIQISPPPPPPPPSSSSQLLALQNSTSSKSRKQTTNSKSDPFWFVKPTRQDGIKRLKYFCPFCPKSFNSSMSLKFHSMNYHPDHIFPSNNIYDLTADQFRACCSTILEEEVIQISNEDGVGSFTTFKCKYCPSSHHDKRFIQKHLIGDHYDKLLKEVENLQLLQGTKEFEDKVGIHMGKEGNRRKVLSNQFKRKWRCDGCGSGFPNFNQLDRHVLRCGRVGGSGSGERGKNYGKHESGSTKPRASPCDGCGKILSSGYSLWRHKRLRCLKGLIKKYKKEGEGGIIVGGQGDEEILPDGMDDDDDPLM